MKGKLLKTDRAGSFLFAVLVPHRNAVFVIEKFRQQIFAAGLDGAFSFPAAAPLALLSRPLSGGELKTAAVELRKLLGGGKFVLSALPENSLPKKSPLGESPPELPAALRCTGSPERLSFFGPCLDMPFPPLPESAVLTRWEKPFLAPAVLGRGGAECVRVPADKLPSPPELSFRAAALANLAIRPAGNGEAEYSYAWEMGRLYWLPNPSVWAKTSGKKDQTLHCCLSKPVV
ncbi:MAG: hypothetical protein LBP29_05545 [Treponema sp.]|jgi:hypothetical protein|nr:hypothetical protein [Treponema sp.]